MEIDTVKWYHLETFRISCFDPASQSVGKGRIWVSAVTKEDCCFQQI